MDVQDAEAHLPIPFPVLEPAEEERHQQQDQHLQRQLLELQDPHDPQPLELQDPQGLQGHQQLQGAQEAQVELELQRRPAVQGEHEQQGQEQPQAQSETQDPSQQQQQQQQQQPQQQQHQQRPPEAQEQQAEQPGGLSDKQRRLLWDSVGRSLLKLGRGGVQESHRRLLFELLAAHQLVKVQLNGANAEALVGEVGAQMAAGGGARLLQTKGRTLLFGRGSATSEQLLQVAERSNALSAMQRESAEGAREARAATRERVEAERKSQARGAQRRVNQLLTTTSEGGRGPLTRQALRDDWRLLADGIAEQEAIDDAAEAAKGGLRGAGAQTGAAAGPAAGARRKSKAPWRQPKPDGQGQQRRPR